MISSMAKMETQTMKLLRREMKVRGIEREEKG